MIKHDTYSRGILPWTNRRAASVSDRSRTEENCHKKHKKTQKVISFFVNSCVFRGHKFGAQASRERKRPAEEVMK